jgi:hypothetical protein
MATRDKMETRIKEDKSIKEHTKELEFRVPEFWRCIGEVRRSGVA